MRIVTTILLLICMWVPVAFSAEHATTVYDSTAFNEDVVWKGSVLVRGAVVVAPQATLRVEPGTTVRFAAGGKQGASLVVQGRLHASGTADKPILFTSERGKAIRGAWGGIVLLATEKKNVLERCRIEHADTALELRYSNLTMKNMTITQVNTGVLGYDSVVHMNNCVVSDSGQGVVSHYGEFDGKDLTVISCQKGFQLHHAAVVLTAAKTTNCQQSGLDAEDSRLRITGSEFSGNALGARIKGGEGQIVSTRFGKNSETALLLSGARLKVQRCLFADNSRDAVQTEDGRALLYNNAFLGNGRYNIFNNGRDAVSARQNWWGSTDQSDITGKIYDAAEDKKSGTVHVSPWLADKPPLTP